MNPKSQASIICNRTMEDRLDVHDECGPDDMDETTTADEAPAAVGGADLAQCVLKQEISEQAPALSSQNHPEADKLLAQAIGLAEGHHFQQAQKVLIRLLKLDPCNSEGWLWYSRVIGSMKAIESSLENAIRISPRNLEIIDENNKFNFAKNRVQAEHIRRCPFCWSAVQDMAVECLYCRSHLFIHKDFFTAARSPRQGVLKKAIARYTQVISREKNIQAYYYLGMAHLNQAQWEEALDHLKETANLAPQNKAYTDQLQALSGYLAGPQSGSVSEEVGRLRESHPFEVNPADGKNNKVLVVDDSAVARKVVKLALERNGYEIFEATNGLEALTRLNTQRPDLVLLDIIMPGMDGYKTLSLIKDSRELKHIPVIMLTSRDKLFDKIKGKMSGSDEYLTKPFDPDDLVTKVSKYLPQ